MKSISQLVPIFLQVVLLVVQLPLRCQAFLLPAAPSSSVLSPSFLSFQVDASTKSTTASKIHIMQFTATGPRKRTTPNTITLLHATSPMEIATVVGGVGMAALAAWLYADGSDDRARSKLRRENQAAYDKYQNERAAKAYIAPKEHWTEAELAAYDGTQDNGEGPILLAADGLVLNVYKGRNFYGPGGEYHLFAGRDATRFLAKTSVEEETPEEAAKPLTLGERAALAGWMFTLKNKYDVVGKLQDFDPSTTSMKVM